MLYASMPRVVVCHSASVCPSRVYCGYTVRNRASRQSHIGFQMTWKLLTLDDLEGQY